MVESQASQVKWFELLSTMAMLFLTLSFFITGNSRPLFVTVFPLHTRKNYQFVGSELRISVGGSNASANCATTAAIDFKPLNLRCYRHLAENMDSLTLFAGKKKIA